MLSWPNKNRLALVMTIQLSVALCWFFPKDVFATEQSSQRDKDDDRDILVMDIQDRTDYRKRLAAAIGMSSTRQDVAREAVPELLKALSDNYLNVRVFSARALLCIGREERAAVSALVGVLTEILHDSSESIDRDERTWSYLYPEIMKTLEDYVDDVQDRAQEVEFRQLGESILALKELEQALQRPYLRKQRRRTVNAISHIQAERRARVVGAISGWVMSNRIITGTVSYILVCLIVWLIVLWRRPLWLLRINDFLKPFTDLPLPKWLGGMKISARALVLVSPFNYQKRVLDAWVARYADKARENFKDEPSVKRCDVYVSLQVNYEAELCNPLFAAKLQREFAKDVACILIVGEGGSGKTSIACQMGKWATADDPAERVCASHQMIPILIQESSDLIDGFVAAIGGRLRTLINRAEAIPDELLLHLLRKRYLMVIVDGYSELSEETRRMIRPSSKDFPVAALVVTSRLNETLGGIPRSTIGTSRIHGAHLSSFLDAYLVTKKKRGFIDDQEFFTACGHLSSMVGQREITVLIAKLYADQMIVAKQSGGSLPVDTPDLMLRYIDEVNDRIAEGRRDIREVHRLLQVIAYECVRRTLRPMSARVSDIICNLQDSGGENLMSYLEERLVLIQTVGGGRDHVRFFLDPLAEYLGALYLIKQNRCDEQLWNEFFRNADEQQGSPEAIKGFLLALHDCCVAQGPENDVPATVGLRLAQRVRLEVAPAQTTL